MTASELLKKLRALDAQVWLEGERVRISAPTGRLTPELHRELVAQKDEIRRLLTQYQDDAEPSIQSTAPGTTNGATEMAGEFPVSFAQRRLWFLDQLEPGNPAYNVAASRFIDGMVNIEALERALNDVVRRHGVLRTIFREVNGEPVQVVQPFQPLRLEVIDLTHLPETARDAEADRVKRAEAAKPFDLAAGPLFRPTLLTLDARRHFLLFSMHHIVCDGWSLGIFLEEVNAHYRAYDSGGTPQVAPLALQYAEYAAREQARLAGPELDRLLEYWRERLGGAPATLELPTDRPRPAQQTYKGGIVEFSLSAALSESIRALARRERATPYMTLLAVFNALLFRYSGQSDIVVGTPIANRDDPGLERLIGLFVSTLAIRSDLSGDPSARTLIAQIRENVLDAQSHQELPFEKVVEALRPERTMAHSPIFQVVFALHNTPHASEFTITSAAAMYDISLFLWDERAGIRGVFEYNTDLFERATVARLSEHFRVLAESMVANPDLPVSRLELQTEAERKHVLVDLNATDSAYPRDATLIELFDAVAAARPDDIALESADPSLESLPVARLTYGELARAANRLAARLSARGIPPGSPVGLYVERSASAAIALLAILKAGGAYVPLDTGNPDARTADILREAGVRLVLCQSRLAARVPRDQIDVLTLEDEWRASKDVTDLPGVPETGPDSLAYVMFTSGTTGRPKGVCVTHRNIVRLVRNTNYAQLGPDEVILQFAPLAFDASTFEIWGALLNGGRLIVYPNRVPTARELAEVLDSFRITTLWLTAGFFHYMVENEVEALARVRQVLAGGDVLSAHHVQRVLDAKRDGVVVNGYGPTENTTFTCCHVMPAGTRTEHTVPIGRPISNTRVYILDTHGEPVPIGVAGELFAGGDGVARGYLGDAAASATKFVPDPFDSRPGAMMYRTGDLARWRADGVVEFLGRRDRQVKVRGFRIELEEIEDALRTCATVQDAAVIARRDASGTNVLVAYLVPKRGEAIEQLDIRRSLTRRLPDYMIPNAFVALDALPLTANGKLDRDALPEPNVVTGADAVTGPRTMLETQLQTIWERVLGRSGFGVRDNFFELGGHSLLAVRMFAQIERVFGRRLPASALFQAPTIEQLAARLEHEGFRSPWDSLVAIQPEGSRPPLFFVPGIGGNVVGYAYLAQLLGPDQPCYGLQSRGLDGREQPFERIEPMAAHYIKEIRRVQPKGPYYLGGACFGGAVAYEMAQQLRAQGEEVAFLMLLETWPPPQRRPLLDVLFRQSHHVRFLVMAARNHIAQLIKLSPRKLLAALRERMKIVGEMVAQRDIYRGDSATMYLDRVSTANYKSFTLYKPRPYDGEVMLVLASAREIQSPKDPRLVWGELARGGYTRFDIPARDSGLVLKSPHAEVLAERMRQMLQRARHECDDSRKDTPEVSLTGTASV